MTEKIDFTDIIMEGESPKVKSKIERDAKYYQKVKEKKRNTYYMKQNKKMELHKKLKEFIETIPEEDFIETRNKIKLPEKGYVVTYSISKK